MKRAIMAGIEMTALAVALSFSLAAAGCAPQEQAQTEKATDAPAASASSTQTDAQTGTASSGQEAAATKWVDVTSASEAAKGAGFGGFGVMGTVSIGDIKFANPKFSYAEGVAQATYESGAAALYVRKANGEHKAPLTDRDKTEFAQKWSQSYEGLDVTLYGPEKDKATVIAWNDGTKDYCVTLQGLGGDEMTMNPDEVRLIVKGIKDAEAASNALSASQSGSQQGQQAQQPQQGEQSQQSQQTTASEYISADAAKDIARNTTGIGLPESLDAELMVGGDAPHYLVTITSGSTTYVLEIDAYTGDVWTIDEAPTIVEDDSDFISADTAKDIARETTGIGIPESMDAQLMVGGDAPHYLVTVTSDGVTYTLQIDAYTGDVWSYENDAASIAEDEEFISSATACDIAREATGIGIPESMYSQLMIGGDAPHYLVTVVLGDESYDVLVDAYTGDVWSIS